MKIRAGEFQRLWVLIKNRVCRKMPCCRCSNGRLREPDVFGARETLDRVRKWLVAADHAIHVKIGDGDVAGVANLERQRKSALASLFFRLQGGKSASWKRCAESLRCGRGCSLEEFVNAAARSRKVFEM